VPKSTNEPRCITALATIWDYRAPLGITSLQAGYPSYHPSNTVKSTESEGTQCTVIHPQKITSDPQ